VELCPEPRVDDFDMYLKRSVREVGRFCAGGQRTQAQRVITSGDHDHGCPVRSCLAQNRRVRDVARHDRDAALAVGGRPRAERFLLDGDGSHPPGREPCSDRKSGVGRANHHRVIPREQANAPAHRPLANEQENHPDGGKGQDRGREEAGDIERPRGSALHDPALEDEELERPEQRVCGRVSGARDSIADVTEYQRRYGTRGE